MRKLIKLAIVALGIRAFMSWRKRRKAGAAAVATVPPAPDPADELRQKLAENRAEDATDETAAMPGSSVDDRRTEVHGQARATIDDMKSSDEG